jgi:hypothetical protein
MPGDYMGSFAHSPGFQDWDLPNKTNQIDPAALAELEAEIRRIETRKTLIRELYYTLGQAQYWLMGLSQRHDYTINDQTAFIHLDRANELREHIEALNNGAPL